MPKQHNYKILEIREKIKERLIVINFPSLKGAERLSPTKCQFIVVGTVLLDRIYIFVSAGLVMNPPCRTNIYSLV